LDGELLAEPENLAGLRTIDRVPIAKAEAMDSPQRVMLVTDSTETPVYGNRSRAPTIDISSPLGGDGEVSGQPAGKQAKLRFSVCGKGRIAIFEVILSLLVEKKTCAQRLQTRQTGCILPVRKAKAEIPVQSLGTKRSA
jgi:hypothetical protein